MDNNHGERILLKRSDPNFENECKQLANDISTQKTTMLDVVLKLEPYFSSKEIDDREEGMHVLSTILEFIDINSLWQQEVAQFCQFYKGRMNDHYKVIPAILNGVVALSKYDKPIKDRPFTALLTAMFQTVSCQAQQYSERLKIYTILRNLLRNQTEELLDLGPDFVYGVISAIDGERDPRNLIFLFQWLPEFINTVKLGHLAEEMYEVMSCYFPVDFRVPASDANGISRDALADALKPCLCASNDFAEPTVQLALEKLDADLQIAKCDSLQLLLFGCKKFPIDVYVQYKTGIWAALQRELLKSPSTEVETLLLETITEVSRKLSADKTNFADVFDNVLETNVGNLNANEKLFAPTSKLFLAMSRGNQTCSQRILGDVQPRLINLFNIAATREHKIGIFTILIEFIKVGHVYNTNTPGIPQFLLTLLLQNDQETRAMSLDALRFISNQQQQFDTVKPVVLEQWGQLFITVTDQHVQRKFHECVLHYAPRCTQELITLINSLPVSDNFGVLMDNLSVLCSTQPFTDVFVNFLSGFFATRTKVCLNSLNNALKLHSLHKLIEASNLVESRVLCCKTFGDRDADDLMNAMEILIQVLGGSSVEEQAGFVAKHLANVLGQFESDPDAIYFVCGIVTNLRLENTADFGILQKLFVMGCEGHCIAAQLLANMINKLEEDVISKYVAHFESFLIEEVNDCAEGKRRGEIAVWLTKALFMRGYHDRFKWIQILFLYMKYEDVVPNGMKTVMRDDSPAFSKFSHCRRRLLYKQEFFLEMCKLLDSAAGSNAVDLTFASLVQEVPTAVLKMNFEKFSRLIFSCLNHVDHPSAPLPILETIRNLIRSGDALTEQYLDDLMPRLVTLAKDSVAMKVRILALHCIRSCANGKIALHKLVKHKAFVTDNLARCVDDRKRLVRKEAADTRLKWFLLGAPI